MSDFPSPESYKTPVSKILTSKLKADGVYNPYPFIIKKEKYQYLYDIDANKYVDFYINNGTAIAGHNTKSLSVYIKDGISAGTETTFINKSYYRLTKILKSLTDFKYVSFYNSLFMAFFQLFKNLRPDKVAVSSCFLKNFLEENFNEIEIKNANFDNEIFDIFIFEPLDFDDDLSRIDFKSVKAKKYISFESRTAFRLQRGFSYTLDDVDFILCSNTLTNGINSAVIFSRTETSGEIIPHYLTLLILECIKYFFRKEIEKRFIVPEGDFITFQTNGIFKLKYRVETKDLLPYGIFLKDNICFLSIHHTEHDIRRLKKALKSLYEI